MKFYSKALFKGKGTLNKNEIQKYNIINEFYNQLKEKKKESKPNQTKIKHNK